MFGDVNYALKAPAVGGRIDVLPRYQDEVLTAGPIANVKDKGLVAGLENYAVTTDAGEKLVVIVLHPDSAMDAEEERCYMLLSWRRAKPDGAMEEPEPTRRGLLKRVAAGFAAQVRERPLVFLGLIVIGVGVIFLLIGNNRLGEAFIDLGVKVFLTLGALVRGAIAAVPAILNQASDWVEPVRFVAGFGA